jgi:hypothetical protein
MRNCALAGVIATLFMASTAVAQQQQGKSAAANAKTIASAMSAGPKDIAANATIAELDAKGNMVTLRKGSNGWLCMPDNPVSPGPDPICADKQWQSWFDAYMNKKPPAVKQVGIAYMYQGGSDASNTDPFATKPTAGNQWISTGAHMMILLPDPKQLESYPGTVAPGAFIMFKGTPYAHLMVTVPKP